jgi:hypothetical protein
MDWTKQTEETLKAWMGTQKQMWDSWVETVQKGAPQFQPTDLWQKTVQAWEEAVKKSLEAQSEWIRMWAESTPATAGLPKGITEWVQQARDMNNRWIDVQRQLWAGWFDLLKKGEPNKMAGSWDKEGQKMAAAWQESVEKIMAAQLDWARRWTGENKAGASN